VVQGDGRHRQDHPRPVRTVQGAINRWWSARTERKQLVAQLREVDDRVHDVVAPTVTDKREQAKVKERLIEREQALSKHMSDREKQVPPVIAPAPVKAPEPSKRVQKEKQVPLFVDSAVEGTCHRSRFSIRRKKQLNYSPESLAASATCWRSSSRSSASKSPWIRSIRAR
jgi:S-DNA-T family DNA segregation ATPase FtsK/SpoIIIE